MDVTQNFDAFLDWDAVDEDMANDLHKAVVEYRNATDIFVYSNTVEAAKNVLRAQEEISLTAQAIRDAIYTQPVLVHVAGPREEEIGAEGAETIVQRCKRCSSVLQMWHENFVVFDGTNEREVTLDEVPWWKEGQQVAKHVGSGIMGMYEINDELKKYEKPCFDFGDLEIGD